MAKMLDVPYRSQWDADANRSTTDCGPACLAMVLDYYGKQVAINELLAATGVSPGKYVGFGQLQRVAKTHGVTFEYSANLKLTDLTRWIDEGKPAIAHTQCAARELCALDVDLLPFAGGDGTSQFVNQAFIANPAFLLALPYTGFTAGAVLPREWGRISTFVYDPKDRTGDFFRLDDLFAKGIIVGGEVGVNTNFFGLPGEQHVGAIWKNVKMTDLSFAAPPPSEYPEPVVPGLAALPDSYTFYYGFDQFFVMYSDKPQKGWGLFGRASLSDANPTPLRYFLSAGLGGNSPIRTERGDTFGAAWYYVGASKARPCSFSPHG